MTGQHGRKATHREIEWNTGILKIHKDNTLTWGSDTPIM